MSLILAAAAAVAATVAYKATRTGPQPVPLLTWLREQGITLADLGADIPIGAVLRATMYELDEPPASWRWRNAWALAVHRDFLLDPKNAQDLIDFPARDFGIVRVKSLLPPDRRGKEGAIRDARHELWHHNNRGPDYFGDRLHEPWARWFEANRAPWAWAFFPASTDPRAVR
jgi:hypothetical protein